MTETQTSTRRPAAGAAVWTGAELAGRDGWVFRLSPAHLTEIDAALELARSGGRELYDIAREDFPLPALAGALSDLARELEHGRGLVLIRGLPVERYDDDALAVIFWGIGCHIGVPLAQSTKGDRLGHVVDLTDGGEPRQMRNYEKGGPLRMHTDLNNDVVGLLMLRAARAGGESRIASSMAIHNIILNERPDYLDALYRGYYFHRLRKERGAGSNLSPHRIPVFSECEGVLSCHFNPSPIDRAVERAGVKLSAVEAGAYRFFTEVANRPGVYLDMDLRPGDIQLINNHVVCHGRTDYDDHPEPARRRHLLRLWLRVPDGRPLAPDTQVHEIDALGFRMAAGAAPDS